MSDYELKCDFCSTPTVDDAGKRAYRARARLVATLPDGRLLIDDGQWVACSACVPLIEARDWPALLDRARALVPTLRAVPPQILPQALDHIAVQWGRIFGEDASAFRRD